MKKAKAETPKIETLDDAALDQAQGGLLPAVNVQLGDGSVRGLSRGVGTTAIKDGTSNTLAAKAADGSV